MIRTPGYPAFLAAVFFSLGRSQLALTSVQAALDALTCAMIVHMAVRLKLKKAAVAWAWFLVATCLFTCALSYQIMTETLYTFLITAALWTLLFPGRIFFCGLLIGLGILVRPGLAPSAALFAGGLALWGISRAAPGALSPRKLSLPALFCAGVGIVVAPWMLRNFLTFRDQFSPSANPQVTLLGAKSPNEGYALFYMKEFHDYVASYEEPFVQSNPYFAPVLARYVYPGEEEQVKTLFPVLEREIVETKKPTAGTLSALAAITEKRYAAAPRLHITAPLSKILKLWVTPRIALLWKNAAGHNQALSLVVLLTLYSLVYILPGFAGASWAVFPLSPPVALFIAGMLLGHTWTHALWLPMPQSRYAVPCFPMLSLASAALLHRLTARGSGSAA